MGGFSNPIIGGGGNLVYPSIQSPDFSLAGKTGWAILKNGNAYFFNIVAEGTITASEFIGTDYLLTSAGAFWYSGTPGSGNLIFCIVPPGTTTDPFGNAVSSSAVMQAGSIANGCLIINDTGDFAIQNSSGNAVVFFYHGDGSARFYGSTGVVAGGLKVAIAPAAGTDGAGNKYYQGLTVYGSGGASAIGIQLPTGYTNELVPGYVATGVAGTTQPYTQLSSPQTSGAGDDDQVYVGLLASAFGTPSSGQGQLVYVDNTGTSHVQVLWGNGGVTLNPVLTATFANAAVPGSVASSAVVFAHSGHLKYVGSDGSAYNTGRATLLSTGQTVSSTTPAAVAGITGINVAAGTYRIHGNLSCKMGSTASGASFAVTGPSASVVAVNVKVYGVNVAGYTGYLSSVVNALATVTTTASIAASASFIIEFDGLITFSAAGATFGLEVAEGTSGDSWTLNANGWLDLMPIS